MTCEPGSGYPLTNNLMSEDKLPLQDLKAICVPAPGYHPNYNPTLPFCEPIPRGLRVGMSVYVQGVAFKNMQRFVVNFALGPDPVAHDIAFHFNPRFDGWNKVIFNSRLSGQWGQEEELKRIPFKNGEHFEVLVTVTEQHYKVLVNGNLFYEYGHRTPIQNITHLYVDGDMTLQSVNFLGSYFSSSEGPGVDLQSPVNLPAMEGPPVFNPPVPFLQKLQGGMVTHRTIIIRGFIPLSAKRFHINFNVGTTGQIALHINPRMDEKAVVRNSFQNGVWGSEERSISYNPFGPGKYFDLSIRASTYHFKVFANGQHVFDYKHRVLATMVDILEIGGDVTLSYVQV
ncbi:galectin-4-like [Sorex fumeus]|uniref:galectin-4-like n=1 Tax=Sorex fumeus TaxID=62283 RepID=UPI0024ACE393|nr:galectin-4-like [Sorex fumeus]